MCDLIHSTCLPAAHVWTPARGIAVNHSQLPDRRGYHLSIADMLPANCVNAQVSSLSPAQMFSDGGWSGSHVTELWWPPLTRPVWRLRISITWEQQHKREIYAILMRDGSQIATKPLLLVAAPHHEMQLQKSWAYQPSSGLWVYQPSTSHQCKTWCLLQIP